MKSKVSKQNIFMRILALPWKALTKARDCYVNKMTTYAMVNPRTLPKSYNRSVSSLSRSINNDSEDFRELVRAASARTMRDNNFDLNFLVQQHIRQQMPSRKLVTRSCSVGMARIDEENSCVLGEGEEDALLKKDLKYPRSRSYGIMKKNNGVF
ncbi:uncharacterized protein LOC132601850 [Lycium barbarum]|uniref:uncharacterized protein LOC132601850 n=1 Tax=Lycium barbarum TaxID=112863 RepID=UPI00293E4B8F|nr:uncharacterized protein LOC132601850 [Lycium barbarum]